MADEPNRLEVTNDPILLFCLDLERLASDKTGDPEMIDALCAASNIIRSLHRSDEAFNQAVSSAMSGLEKYLAEQAPNYGNNDL